LPLVQPPLETASQLVATRPLQAGIAQLPLGMGSWDNAHTFDPFNRGKRLGEEPSTLVGAQEVRAPPPLGFPHIMLNVKRVKDNMRLTFIEKLFTNREIETSVQTRYLRFKGMSYESKSYLCDINCVQLRKALAGFRCGNTQLEVVLGV
jgi:hypothetical protein